MVILIVSILLSSSHRDKSIDKYHSNIIYLVEWSVSLSFLIFNIFCWSVLFYSLLDYPLIRVGMPKYGASLLVFLVSALLHEVIISLPFRHIYFYAFIGMLGQVPMGLFSKLIDKTFDNSSLGNICFWCAFCVFGQPIGVLLYSYDVWKLYSKQQI
jgi:hypothetical protein